MFQGGILPALTMHEDRGSHLVIKGEEDVLDSGAVVSGGINCLDPWFPYVKTKLLLERPDLKRDSCRDF